MTDDPESRAWRRPPPDARQRRTDALAAAGIFAVAVLSMVLTRAVGLYSDPLDPAASVAILAAVTLPLAARRWAPVPVVAVVATAFILAGELSLPETTIASIALFIAIYSVGAWERSRTRATVARVVVVLVMAVWLLVSFFRASTQDIDFDGPGVGALTPVAAFMLIQVLVNALYFAGAWWFGEHAFSSARQRAITDLRARELEDERATVSRQAVVLERLRIARELHDAVAHHVSLIGVQAAAARAQLESDPVAAREQLEALEDSSREAVGELYQLLGTLRDAPGPQEATAALDLDGLDRLVAEAAAGGLRVELDRIGPAVEVPPLVGLNLYRIAQEALTNVRKHAGPGTRVRVLLRSGDDHVELEVVDDGRGRPGARPAGGGLGLLGMRERAASLGAELEAAPRRGGSGWIVRVRVPLPVRSPA